jgi:hypothetical protein
LEELFFGVHRACFGTRGVVMALIRFDWNLKTIQYANMGNIGIKTCIAHQKDFIVKRGVLGVQIPIPFIGNIVWNSHETYVLYSDGIKNHHEWPECETFTNKSASILAVELLKTYNLLKDDATVVVIKERSHHDE